MTREMLQKMADDFSDNSPLNYLGANTGANADGADAALNNYEKNNLYARAKDPDAFKKEDFGEHAGLRFFERPVFSITRADNPEFLKIKFPEVVGEHHMMPEDWLPGAKTVISFFLPYNRKTVEANKTDPFAPPIEWLYTRVDGQRYLLSLGAKIRDLLISEGFEAITPYTDDRFIMRTSHDVPGTESIPKFSTNWSERHVGVVSGLGTFGLSTNFISKVGCAGRMISVVTTWDIEADERDYDDWLGYCNRCGACLRRCPAKAHFSDKVGKDHAMCSAHIAVACKPFSPRYGCGKCQSGLPCDYKPMKPQ